MSSRLTGTIQERRILWCCRECGISTLIKNMLVETSRAASVVVSGEDLTHWLMLMNYLSGWVDASGNGYGSHQTATDCQLHIHRKNSRGGGLDGAPILGSNWIAIRDAKCETRIRDMWEQTQTRVVHKPPVPLHWCTDPSRLPPRMCCIWSHNQSCPKSCPLRRYPHSNLWGQIRSRSVVCLSDRASLPCRWLSRHLDHSSWPSWYPRSWVRDSGGVSAVGWSSQLALEKPTMRSIERSTYAHHSASRCIKWGLMGSLFTSVLWSKSVPS